MVQKNDICGIPLREMAGFRTLIRALCEPGRTSKRIFPSFGGFWGLDQICTSCKMKGKMKRNPGNHQQKGDFFHGVSSI